MRREITAKSRFGKADCANLGFDGRGSVETLLSVGLWLFASGADMGR